MIPYIFIAIFPIVLFLVAQQVSIGYRKNCKNSTIFVRINWIYLFLAILPIGLMIALRNKSIGADTGVYIARFKELQQIPWSELFDDTRMEKGYLLFSKFINSFISTNEVVFFSICSFICMLCIGIFAYKNCKQPVLFVFLYVTLGLFTFMLSGLRQSLAMCICLLGFEFAKKRKFIPFLLVVLLAFTFHKSAVFYIFVYFIVNRMVNLKNIIIYSILAFILILNLDRVQAYIGEALDYTYQIESTGNGGIFLLIMILITGFSWYYLKDDFDDIKIRALFYKNLIAIFFWIAILVTRTAERPSYYFLFATIALFAETIVHPKKKENQKILLLIIIGCCLLLYIYRFYSNFSSFIPYRTFLSNEI